MTSADLSLVETTGLAEPSTRARLAPRRRPALLGQLGRYTIVGMICTAVFSGTYLILARPLGATVANTIAMVLAAVLNTTLNRRHTFGVDGRDGAVRHHLQGLVIMALTWVLTTSALTGLHALAPKATPIIGLLVLSVANLGGTGMRFALLRWWVFKR